ncbi:MAG: hypothetical protein ACO3ID_02130 [Candidatus Nanopelagicales bacterium]
MRRMLTAVTSTALMAAAIGFAAPASAMVAADVQAIRLSAPYAQAPTDVVVVAKLTQTSYENISLNIALHGFRAHQVFAYGDGQCPTSVAVVDAPVTVFECGWQEEGGIAKLRLALEGTMPSGKVKVRIKSDAVTAPARAGTYRVTMSSWAFDKVITKIAITSGPFK